MTICHAPHCRNDLLLLIGQFEIVSLRRGLKYRQARLARVGLDSHTVRLVEAVLQAAEETAANRAAIQRIWRQTLQQRIAGFGQLLPCRHQQPQLAAAGQGAQRGSEGIRVQSVVHIEHQQAAFTA